MNHENAEKIWQTVLMIPHGKVSSYGRIADLAGLPGRSRLVGRIMQYAPASMHIPWYRVLRSDGRLAFAAGTEMALKQSRLLQEEGVWVMRNRVDLSTFLWSPDLGEMLMMEH